MNINDALKVMNEKADEYARLFTEAGVTVKKDVRYLNRFFAEIQNPKRAKYMTVTLTLSTDTLEEDYESCLSIGAELVRGGKPDYTLAERAVRVQELVDSIYENGK